MLNYVLSAPDFLLCNRGMETDPGEFELPSWTAWSIGLAPEALMLNEQQTQRRHSEQQP